MAAWARCSMYAAGWRGSLAQVLVHGVSLAAAAHGPHQHTDMLVSMLPSVPAAAAALPCSSAHPPVVAVHVAVEAHHTHGGVGSVCVEALLQ